MNRRPADWQLPAGVDRGLWDYLHSAEMVSGYDKMMSESPLATQDVRFCESHFPRPGKLVDLGCGTGRLARHMAQRGFQCVGVDLSLEMLKSAEESSQKANLAVEWVHANLVEMPAVATAQFDYAACLFSTLGMIRGGDQRQRAMKEFARILQPGGLLVLHIHRRWYSSLGYRWIMQQIWPSLMGLPTAGDMTMTQHYGGAPLTLHHFTWKEAIRLLQVGGFRFRLSEPIYVGRSVYGHLILAERV